MDERVVNEQRKMMR